MLMAMEGRTELSKNQYSQKHEGFPEKERGNS